MENLQEKLEEYRLRQRRKERLDTFKECIKSLFKPNMSEKIDKVLISIDDDRNNETEPLYNQITPDKRRNNMSVDDDSDYDETDAPITEPPKDESKVLKYTLWIVYFLFWVTLYIIAIELKFGIVFFMISALVGIYLNTRTGPKKENEISAYSVFNKNFESIDGTLKAEQFERELFYNRNNDK